MPKETILIIDDEENIRKTLAAVLADEGYDVVTAASGREGLDRVQETQFALALLDIAMPEMDGMETLRRIKDVRPDLPVIMISGHGTIETAVKTTKMGAYDFIEKPLSLERVSLAVRHGLEEQRLREENESLRSRIEKKHEIIGESPKIKALKHQISGSTARSSMFPASGKDASARFGRTASRLGRLQRRLSLRGMARPHRVPPRRGDGGARSA